MIRSRGTNCFRKTAPICTLGGLPFNSTAIIRAERRCIVGIMAKPFVICHGEETKERDRIALVALICARVYCVDRELCVFIIRSLSIASSLSLFIISSVNNAVSAASCVLFAVR